MPSVVVPARLPKVARGRLLLLAVVAFLGLRTLQVYQLRTRDEEWATAEFVGQGRAAAAEKGGRVFDDSKYVVCTRVRNEAPYLSEWIEYHRMIGFDAFLVLNDESDDDTQCLLDAYAAEGVVIRVPTDIDYAGPKFAKNNDRVFDACADYLQRRQDRFDPHNTWMLTHDVDEFVHVATSGGTVRDAVAALRRRRPAARSVQVPRLLFGASGRDRLEPGLVIDRFTRRFNHESCPPPGHDGIADGRGRRLFEKEMPASYCESQPDRSDDNAKSVSLVSSMAVDCYALDDAGEKVPWAYKCANPHAHTVVDDNVRNPEPARGVRDNRAILKKDDRYINMEDAGDIIVNEIAIMHYMTKSRQEFYGRICDSTWSKKYFLCEGCTPETHFDLTETFANNFEDARMTSFSPELRRRLEASGVGSSCDLTKNELRSLDYYRECFERTRKDLLDEKKK